MRSIAVRRGVTNVRRASKVKWKGAAVAYLYLAPFLILFVVFRIYPLLYGLYVSLTKATFGTTHFPFIGLGNFARLSADPRFHAAALNTVVFTLEATVPVLALPLLLATILNRAVAWRTLIRSIFFFPFTLSVVTVGLIWAWMLDPVSGPFSYYLQRLGITTPAWLGDAHTAMPAIVLATVWSVTGYYLVIFLAAMQDIPSSLLEAADLDGANAWQRFWSITFPLLRPVVLLVLVVHITGAFQIFGLVNVMTRGGPADATLTVVQYIYEQGFQGSFDLGSAAAMSWLLFIAISIVSAVQFRIFRQQAEY